MRRRTIVPAVAMQEDGSTRRRLRRIAKRVRKLLAVFSCGGTVELASPVALQFRSGHTLDVVDPRESWRPSDLGKRLMKQCDPAPFGVGNETRHDRRVRDGGQLLAADGGLRVQGLDLCEAGILEEIRRALCGDDAAPPEAELYALNVYGSRGHFVRHKDTPRDPDCFGTLVVCLPVRFDGGRLLLRHGVTRSYAWGSAAYFAYGVRGEEPYRVKWAAFYGDVDHEIEPVREGTRVTLTYLLRRTLDTPLARRAADASEDHLEGELRAALDDPRFMPEGGTLGLLCLHSYGEEEGVERSAELLSEGDACRLKGRDRLFALAAMRAGLRVRYQPYLYENCAADTWPLSRAPTAREKRLFERVQVGLEDLAETMPIADGPRADDDVTWILPPMWDYRQTGGQLDDPHPAADLVGEVEYSATDYFGNEGADTCFYVTAALLMTIPPSSERAKQKPRPHAVLRLVTTDAAPRAIRPRDLEGLPGLRMAPREALLRAQPRSVREALAIPGVGRKTTRALLRAGLLSDPDGLQ